MQCPKCHSECPPEYDFCPNCAAPLQVTCPQCSFRAPANFKFCPKCATVLAAPTATPSAPTSPAADAMIERLLRQVPKEYAERVLATRGQPHDERRTVTILFSDVKGSTAMMGKLDPEDAKEVIQGAFEFLIAPIYRYEGTLVQLMGDAILAFFGAPIAHEDDPERACRAGLEMTTEARRYAEKLERERGIQGFSVRVGINTGLVVVGEVGSDLRVAYTAVGDAINLAARMEQNAEPGTVLITENTHKLISPLFETQALGAIQVKGKAEPVSVHRVLAAKPAAGKVRGIVGLESPLVGRDAEFIALREALERLHAGVGGIVTIIGEAGLGKSRLVAEVRKSVGARPRHTSGETAPVVPLQWVEGRCLSYGTSIAYLLWLDVLRGLLGVTVEDSPQQVRGRLHQRAQALCGASAERHLPYLARMLSLALDAETEARLCNEDGQQLKDRTFEAVEELLRCAASEEPVVLICEDLHWADPTSLELLEGVLTLTDRAPLLLICAFRPDPAHGSCQLREAVRSSHRQHYTELELRPLSTAESQTLVGNLLQAADLTVELRQRIITATEGNPFFVEEVIRGLMDSGTICRDEVTGRWVVTSQAGDIVIPDTLQGVLLARLDRLQEDTKRVLQMAAVIGRVFLYRVLGAIAAEQSDLDRHLLTLQRQEMIRERARIPELEYIFKHELTREAAYNGLLKKERRTFHGQVAEALERLFPERIQEQLGLLAYHWERAGHTAKATEYLVRAGDQARMAYAHAEAVDYYRRALELTPETDYVTRFALVLAREKVRHMQGAREAQDEDLSTLEKLAEVMNDDRARAEAAMRRANYAEATSDYPAAVSAVQRGIASASRLTDDRQAANQLLGTGHLIWGDVLRKQYQFVEAQSHLEQALRFFQQIGATQQMARALRVLGNCFLHQDKNTEAARYFQQSLVLSQEIGDRTCAGSCLNNLGIVYGKLGQHEQSQAHFQQALAILREVGDRRSESKVLSCLGVLSSLLGQYPQAKAYAEQALQIQRDVGDRLGQRMALHNLGLYVYQLGALDEARAYAEQALAVAREVGDRHGEASALSDLFQISFDLGDYAQAQAHLEGAMSIVQNAGIHFSEGDLLANRAQLALAQGRLTEAQEDVARILPQLRDAGYPIGSRLVCYQVLQAAGDPQAVEVLSTAYHLLQAQAENISDEELRRSFLENDRDNKEVVDEWERLQHAQ